MNTDAKQTQRTRNETMNTSGDPGIQIWKAAKALTPDQLAELLAVSKTTLAIKGPTFMHKLHRDGETYGPLIESGIIAWGKPPKGFGRNYGSVKLTEFGQHALLCRATWDLRAAGAIPQEESHHDGE
jgi:hypothetical protein